MIGFNVCDREVETAVAVEITGGDGAGPGPRRIDHLGPEGAIAVAQQHRDAALALDGQIEPAVAVEVTRRDALGVGSRHVRQRTLKGSVTVTEQHGYVARP